MDTGQVEPNNIVLDHTCRVHETYQDSCKACRWWKKHGKCNPKKHKKFDPNALYAHLLKYYIEEREFTLEQANEMAQKIVQDQIEHHKNKAQQTNQLICSQTTLDTKAGQ